MVTGTAGRDMKETIIACVALVLGLGLPPAAVAQGKPKAADKGLSYADEDRDWGIAPTTQLRTENLRAPTPRQITGGRAVRTVELQKILTAKERPYLIDVAAGAHRTLAGAFWLDGAGAGNLNAEQQKRFLKAIASFAAGRKNRALVFLCEDAQCWLAHNAARRAIAAGYTNVMWYRGGVAAWRAAGLAMAQADPFAW
jgi:PQQ-dependent catabolism-associated CXXCW motif protein